MRDETADVVLERMLKTVGTSADNALAKALGVTAQAVSEARRRQKVPPAWSITLAKRYQVSLDWLMLGIDPMRPDRQRPHGEVDLVYIPKVEAVLSAGRGSLETGTEGERKYAFRSDFLRRKGNADRMVLIRVYGDSMEPAIYSGDMVLIDQSQKTLVSGKLYAVGVEDMVFIKLVSAMPGKILLNSLNSAMYPPVEITTRGDLEDAVRIIGRCLWSCREL